ncbi:VanZ family protein [Peribacillus sp. SIMBA_075]|uniref:VanZ family protein n=1 Tax=Peribacillus sp. SIMBA_075 TaxID=3085813 RepID=UPI00397C7989
MTLHILYQHSKFVHHNLKMEYLLLPLHLQQGPNIMVTMLISIGIELIQFIENSTGSAFDLYSRLTNIDDVILNTLGGVIGVYIYLLFNHFISKGKSERLQI